MTGSPPPLRARASFASVPVAAGRVLVLVLLWARAAAAEEGATGGALAVDGYVQADLTLADQASAEELLPDGTSLNRERFVLRRARLRARYTQGHAGAAAQLDGNTVAGATVRLINAELFVEWPARQSAGITEAGIDARRADPRALHARAALGLVRIPFGREVQERDEDRLFLERSTLAQAFFPGTWDVGVRGEADWRNLSLAVAVMNGQPIGTRSFPGGDPDAGKDVIGRVGLRMGEPGRGVAAWAGASALVGVGFHPGTPATKDTLVWRDVNEDGIVDTTEIQVIAGRAATPSETFARFGVGADVAVELEHAWTGRTRLTGEVVWAENLDRGVEPADPVSAGRDLRELGFLVSLVQAVTRWGEAGVRLDWYRPDRDASERQGADLVPRDNRYATLAFAAAVRPTPFFRFVVQVERRWNALGRDDSGQPTTLGSHAVTLRGEADF